MDEWCLGNGHGGRVCRAIHIGLFTVSVNILDQEHDLCLILFVFDTYMTVDRNFGGNIFAIALNGI